MRPTARAATAIALMAVLAGCTSAPDASFDKDAYALDLFERSEQHRSENGGYPRSVDDVEDDKPEDAVNVWFMTNQDASELCIEVVTLRGRATVYSDDPTTVVNEQCSMSRFG